MEDCEIVELYWQRDENAIAQSKTKYGKMILGIANRVLFSNEDSEEVENDTYLSAWNSMPDNRPEKLGAYLGKIARQEAIDVYRKKTSDKRAASTYATSLDEIECIVPDNTEVDEELNAKELQKSINRFLETVDKEARVIFIFKYFYFYSVKEIAEKCKMKEATVKTELFRTRAKLRQWLEGEGYNI